jgi:hypothetical protein
MQGRGYGWSQLRVKTAVLYSFYCLDRSLRRNLDREPAAARQVGPAGWRGGYHSFMPGMRPAVRTSMGTKPSSSAGDPGR